MKVPDLLKKPVRVIDIGAVGDVPAHWLPLQEQMELTGFEPDSDACESLNIQKHNFHKASYHPFAIGEKSGKKTLYITSNNECCSLLEPNLEWLSRFDYGSFFEIKKKIEIDVRSLDEIEELGKDIDAVKIDSQGMELPILRGANDTLKNIFLLEIETGLYKNYHEETTFDEIAPYLRSRGFICMEIKSQPHWKRKNASRDWSASKGQSVASESIWVQDLLCSHSSLASSLTREKFLSILSLCWLFEYADLAVEFMNQQKFSRLLTPEEFQTLQHEQTWSKPSHSEPAPNLLTRFLGKMSHFLPTLQRRNLYACLPRLAEEENWFKSLLGSRSKK
jgi:FkbM family methyltransferase